VKMAATQIHGVSHFLSILHFSFTRVAVTESVPNFHVVGETFFFHLSINVNKAK